ncbi:MAG: hypothetical protein WBW41_20965 [Verrucomicrobiia bacterium]
MGLVACRICCGSEIPVKTVVFMPIRVRKKSNKPAPAPPLNSRKKAPKAQMEKSDAPSVPFRGNKISKPKRERRHPAPTSPRPQTSDQPCSAL